MDPPLASPDAGTIGAAVLSHPKQAGERAAEMASQRLLSQAHPAALEGRVHTWVLGGLHGQKHCA